MIVEIERRSSGDWEEIREGKGRIRLRELD